MHLSDEQTNGLDDEAFNRTSPSPGVRSYINSTMTQFVGLCVRESKRKSVLYMP